MKVCFLPSLMVVKSTPKLFKKKNNKLEYIFLHKIYKKSYSDLRVNLSTHLPKQITTLFIIEEHILYQYFNFVNSKVSIKSTNSYHL